jgi:hypothetical protein
MAVKTWSAGEVLAAADLNDTIADAKNAPAPFNLLYNGAMQVAQRGTSTASITASGYYTADRWYLNLVTLGTWTQTVENDAPTGSGFSKSLKVLCTTADAAPSAADLFFIQHRLEGQDVQRIAKGTSAAQQLTLSFWVKSNVTGTYVAELFDVDNTRQISATYSVSASATWEKKTITFDADTTGAFDNDNAGSLFLTMWLDAGSNYTSGTLNTSWASSTNANRAVGQTNLAAATNNYWQVTGVQLEVGPTATQFEFKSYGTELAECQRYYYRTATGTGFFRASGFNVTTTVCDVCVPLQTSMRVAPTAVEVTGTAANYEVRHQNTVTACSSVPTLLDAGTNHVTLRFTVASGLTAGQGAQGRTAADGYVGWTAEL